MLAVFGPPHLVNTPLLSLFHNLLSRVCLLSSSYINTNHTGSEPSYPSITQLDYNWAALILARSRSPGIWMHFTQIQDTTSSTLKASFDMQESLWVTGVFNCCQELRVPISACFNTLGLELGQHLAEVKRSLVQRHIHLPYFRVLFCSCCSTNGVCKSNVQFRG